MGERDCLSALMIVATGLLTQWLVTEKRAMWCAPAEIAPVSWAATWWACWQIVIVSEFVNMASGFVVAVEGGQCCGHMRRWDCTASGWGSLGRWSGAGSRGEKYGWEMALRERQGERQYYCSRQ